MKRNEMLRVRFEQVWKEAKLSGDARNEFARLARRYGEKHRGYHMFTHIADCLEKFSRVRRKARSSLAMEFAFWYHDVIYDPKAKDNEEQSARFVRDVLLRAGASNRLIASVTAFILATKKHVVDPSDRDTATLIDIDLSILGSDPKRFAVYERGIRREYGFVSDEAYREGRGNFLKGMLARERIFTTRFFRKRLETRARKNMAAFR
jgi:predicted metal-dependent HD superfamily phosphohydrolase